MVKVPLDPHPSPPGPVTVTPVHPDNPRVPKEPTSPQELDLSSECPPSPSDTKDYRLSHAFRWTHPGCLHLTPSSASDYLDLPYCAEDEYELIEGILHHREGGDLNHQGLLMFYHARMQSRRSYLPSDARLELVNKAMTEIPAADDDPSCSAESSYVTPDMTVQVRSRSEADSDNFYSSDRIVAYPADKPPPDLIIEITSPVTRTMDLECKVKLYARCKVANYVVVDREECRVVLYGFESSTDQEYTKCEEFRGKEIIESFPLKEMKITAEDLLMPPVSIEEALDSPVKREKALVEEAEAALSGVKEQRAREQSRHDEERARNRARHEEERARNRARHEEERARNRARYEEERARDRARYEEERAHDRARYEEERARDKSLMEKYDSEIRALKAQLEALQLEERKLNGKGSGTSLTSTK